MKIHNISLANFKRFTDLEIQDIPKEAKLVVLIGPNGCGKSSLLDALHSKSYEYARLGNNYNQTYHSKIGSSIPPPINISFHDFNPQQPRDMHEGSKAIYVRTAYRNDPSFSLPGAYDFTDLFNQNSLSRKNRFGLMIENDPAVRTNYQRVIDEMLSKMKESGETLVGDFLDKILLELKNAIQRIFREEKESLTLDGFGSTESQEFNVSFSFSKGASKNFLYMNLSGGEKSVFDLLLDLAVKKVEYDNTVFAIDEPDIHLGTRIQGNLLEEMYRMINDESQLWIATHSLGMMRKALELRQDEGDKIIFLDFTDRLFDEKQVLQPINPNRSFWQKVNQIALDDIDFMVAPSQVVLCEGKSGEDGFDAICYNTIFSDEYPDTLFVSAGNNNSVQSESVMAIVKAIAKVPVIRLIDRDEATNEERARKQKKGIRVLLKSTIEEYLLDDDVLRKFCASTENPSGADELINKKNELISKREKFKNIAQALHLEVKQKLGIKQSGNTRESFMSDHLAKHMTPEMEVYKELKSAIFGDETPSNTA